MTERRIDSEIRLIPYYRNDGASLPWYQDLDVCRQVDDRATPYDLALLHRMYDYLCAHGDCYYIEYRGALVGDVSLRDSGMAQATANIYSFNRQSQQAFLAVGFEKTDEEWYTYRLTPKTQQV